jgi:hypothetical protein
MINNFFTGLIILGISAVFFLKPQEMADLLPPTFFTDKLGMSSRSAYQVIGLLVGTFGLLILVGIIRPF